MCHFPHLFNKINNVVVIGEVNGQTGDLQNPFIYCIFVWGLSLSLSLVRDLHCHLVTQQTKIM